MVERPITRRCRRRAFMATGVRIPPCPQMQIGIPKRYANLHMAGGRAEWRIPPCPHFDPFESLRVVLNKLKDDKLSANNFETPLIVVGGVSCGNRDELLAFHFLPCAHVFDKTSKTTCCRVIPESPCKVSRAIRVFCTRHAD